MSKPLYVSYSSVSAFRKCPRYYYWRHVKKLEKRVFRLPFIVGRIMHHGLQTLFQDKKKAEKELGRAFRKEAAQARKEFTLSPVEEDDLAAQEFVTHGMLEAFRRNYNKFLQMTTHTATEFPLRYQLNRRVIIVGKIDCIVENRGLEWLWELKNLKTLDMDRVTTIRTDPQTRLYHTVHNRMKKRRDWLDGIIYQIIRKPSIRQKQKETRRQYLNRLQEWYSAGEGGMKFHLERIKSKDVNGEAVLSMVDHVSQQMLNCRGIDHYFQDASQCVSEWAKCDFYGVCHGDAKRELRLLHPRKSHHVRADEAAASIAE